MNNMLPKETDKIFINPKFWDKWGKDIQQSFIEYVNISVLFNEMQAETNKSMKWKYSFVPWNLFDCLEK